MAELSPEHQVASSLPGGFSGRRDGDRTLPPFSLDQAPWTTGHLDIAVDIKALTQAISWLCSMVQSTDLAQKGLEGQMQQLLQSSSHSTFEPQRQHQTRIQAKAMSELLALELRLDEVQRDLASKVSQANLNEKVVQESDRLHSQVNRFAQSLSDQVDLLSTRIDELEAAKSLPLQATAEDQMAHIRAEIEAERRRIDEMPDGPEKDAALAALHAKEVGIASQGAAIGAGAATSAELDESKEPQQVGSTDRSSFDELAQRIQVVEDFLSSPHEGLLLTGASTRQAPDNSSSVCPGAQTVLPDASLGGSNQQAACESPGGPGTQQEVCQQLAQLEKELQRVREVGLDTQKRLDAMEQASNSRSAADSLSHPKETDQPVAARSNVGKDPLAWLERRVEKLVDNDRAKEAADHTGRPAGFSLQAGRKESATEDLAKDISDLKIQLAACLSHQNEVTRADLLRIQDEIQNASSSLRDELMKALADMMQGLQEKDQPIAAKSRTGRDPLAWLERRVEKLVDKDRAKEQREVDEEQGKNVLKQTVATLNQQLPAQRRQIDKCDEDADKLINEAVQREVHSEATANLIKDAVEREVQKHVKDLQAQAVQNHHFSSNTQDVEKSAEPSTTTGDLRTLESMMTAKLLQMQRVLQEVQMEVSHVKVEVERESMTTSEANKFARESKDASFKCLAGTSEIRQMMSNFANALRGLQRDSGIHDGRLDDLAKGQKQLRLHLDAALPQLWNLMDDFVQCAHTSPSSTEPAVASESKAALAEGLAAIRNVLEGADGDLKSERPFVSESVLHQAIGQAQADAEKMLKEVQESFQKELVGKADAAQVKALLLEMDAATSWQRPGSAPVARPGEEDVSKACISRKPLGPARCIVCDSQVKAPPQPSTLRRPWNVPGGMWQAGLGHSPSAPQLRQRPVLPPLEHAGTQQVHPPSVKVSTEMDLHTTNLCL